MPITFTEQDLQRMVPKLSRHQERVLRFYEGDHFQNGEGWVGPTLPLDDPNSALLMAEIKRLFTSQNVIKEVIDRVVSGLVGIPPDWTVTVSRDLDEDEVPTPDEQERIDLATDWLTRWWSRDQGLVSSEDQLWSPLRVFRRALALGLSIGRAPLRIFIPTDRWADIEPEEILTIGDRDPVATGSVASRPLPRLSPEEAIESVFIHLPSPDQADIHIDHQTLRSIGVYVAQAQEGGSLDYEIHQVEGQMSVIQQYRGGRLTEEAALDLVSHPLMIELGIRDMVEESLLAQQRLLNMVLTMLGRNTVQAGFLERVILNGQLPGEEVTDPVTGEVTFVPGSFAVGPGRTAFVPGIETENADGTKTYTNPSVVYRDPVNPDTFLRSMSSLYQGMLHSVHQEHVLLSDADASGESRKQSRADFEMILEDHQEAVRSGLQWLFETVMHLFGVLTGSPRAFADLTVRVEPHTYLGPLSTTEMDSLVKQTESGLISKQTARVRLGIRDPENEARIIRQEEEEGGSLQAILMADALNQVRARAAQESAPENPPNEEMTSIESGGEEEI